MGEAVVCYMWSVNTGVKILCGIQLMFHTLLLVVPPVTPLETRDSLHTLADYFEYLFCANSTFKSVASYGNFSFHYNSSFNSISNSSNSICSDYQKMFPRLLVPYMEGINIVLLLSNCVLAILGQSNKPSLINYLVNYSLAIVQVMALGFLAVCRFPERMEGYFVVLLSSPFLWSLAVVGVALRKRLAEDKRLHAVRILINGQNRPSLLNGGGGNNLTVDRQTSKDSQISRGSRRGSQRRRSSIGRRKSRGYSKFVWTY